MAIHTQLPIHKKGIELLSLAFKAQVQMLMRRGHAVSGDLGKIFQKR